MAKWDDTAVDIELLRKKAYNLRWAELDEDVIPLTAADPDFKAAPEIGEALIEYIKEGYFCYTPRLGFDSFKESIAKALKERKNEDVDARYILPIDSVARGMDVIASSFLKPGDEAIVFDPVDFLFKTAVENAGAKVIFYPCKFDDDGYIKLDDIGDYISPNTRMICLCNPHNPLGRCYRREELDGLLSIAEEKDLYIMNDEIWSDIVYSDSEFISLLSFGAKRNRHTISVMGFSKSFGLAGLRIGAIYCTNEEDFKKIVDTSKVLSTVGGISSLSQIAGKAALDKAYYWVDEFVSHLQENRDYIYQRINSIDGLSCEKPMATYVMFIDIRKTGMDSVSFVDHMKEKVKLALVPGSESFFGPGAEGHVRLCFATSKDILKEGLDRLEKGMSLLKS